MTKGGRETSFWLTCPIGAGRFGRDGRLTPGLPTFGSYLLIAERFPVDPGADDALFTAAYTELKRVARRHLRVRAENATLNTTELVHEAFLKLSNSKNGWDNRAHFFGAASRAMRQVLVDFARQRQAAKRGGAWHAVTLSDAAADAALEVQLDEILALDSALERLDAVEQRLRQIVELRFFGGVPEPEIALMLGISDRTVQRDWLRARIFLLNELNSEPLSHGH